MIVSGVSFASGCGKGIGYGIDSFVKNPPAVVKGKRLGLITNHTGADSKGRSDIDLIRAMKDVKLVALFGPEHGIRGDAEPGEKLTHGVDAKTGIPVYSLYGQGMDSRKPKPEMLADVDVLMFDIQDVGARCYTYPYTMALGMKAAAEKRIPFVVLDRPNPIGGEMVESNLLDPKFSTFVGLYPIPMRHGMTVGELAQLFNKEFGIGADLHVVRAPGWKRGIWFDKTGRKWVKPSPNLPRLESAIHYPGTVAFEGTNLSCGRGTSHPFEQVGAPWLDSAKVIEAMEAAAVPGVRFEPVSFTPMAMGDRKYDNQLCQGVRLVVLDRKVYKPVRASAILVDRIRAIHPKDFQFRIGHFDRLAGTDRLRTSIEQGKLNEFLKTWEPDEQAFRETRKPYLLYE
jgi:uncharacterized protein YbbC (DUF1343 family)